MKSTFYTTYYPNQNIYTTNDASIYNWKKVTQCIVIQKEGIADHFVVVPFTFHPRKQTLELKKSYLRSLKKIGGLRVDVITYECKDISQRLQNNDSEMSNRNTMKKIKLSKKSVKQYEKMSGFKTDGNVTLIQNSDEAQKIYEELLLPKHPQNNETVK